MPIQNTYHASSIYAYIVTIATHKYIQPWLPMESQKQPAQHIKGALWGAVLGDVIGAHLEFDKDISPAKIADAFKIVGGGKHQLGPGQPTDDSELNFSVIKGLSRSKSTLNLNFIAEEMANWFLSNPFDVGNTIRNSVPKACNMKQHQAHLCRKGAFERSQTSQSNGSLMALIGLSIWCHRLSPKEIIKAVRQFTILIHPNELVVLSNCFYALMVQFLLNNIQDQDRARKSVDYAKVHVFQYSKNKEFAEWIQTVQQSFQNIGVLQQSCAINKASGWVRVALSYSVYFLVRGKSYRESIQWIISQKGDTDTNSCIMGGLLGAYYGVTKLAMDAQIDKIRCWTSKRRPEWLNPGKVIPQFLQLAKLFPTQLQMVGSSQQYPAFKK